MSLITYSLNLFRARSSDRDQRTDDDRADSIIAAIDTAIAETEAERVGLQQRLETATAMAAMTVGTGVDEYADRDSDRTAELRSQEDQMRNATTRLAQLDRNILNLRSLRESCVANLYTTELRHEANAIGAAMSFGTNAAGDKPGPA